MVKIVKEGVPQNEIDNRYIGTFLCPYCTTIFELRQSDMKEFWVESSPQLGVTASGKCPSCNRPNDHHLDVSHLYERKRLEL